MKSIVQSIRIASRDPYVDLASEWRRNGSEVGRGEFIVAASERDGVYSYSYDTRARNEFIPDRDS